MNNKEKYSDLIKSKALAAGFQSCGISKAGFLEEEAPHLEQWLKNQFHGEMRYMENHFDKRLDPRLLVMLYFFADQGTDQEKQQIFTNLKALTMFIMAVVIMILVRL